MISPIPIRRFPASWVVDPTLMEARSDFVLRNSMIFNGQTAAIRLYTSDASAAIDNCKLFNCGSYGVYEDHGVIHVRNTISIQNNRDFSVMKGTQSHNLSSDQTATGEGSLFGKSSGDQFVSTTDLHLKSYADAINQGLNLSDEFSTDIDGQTRPVEENLWDTGADERYPTPSSDIEALFLFSRQ